MITVKQILKYAIEGIDLKIDQCEKKIVKAKSYITDGDNMPEIDKFHDIIGYNEQKIKQLMEEKYELECYLS